MYTYGPYSDTVTTALTQPPTVGQVMGLTATPTSTSIDLAWQAATGADAGYEIERKLGTAQSGAAFALVGQTSGANTSWSDNATSDPGNAPAQGNTYTYRVRGRTGTP